MNGFRFEIGDVITMKAMLPSPSRWESPQRLVVVERLTQECHGGIQRHYGVRAVNKGNSYLGGQDWSFMTVLVQITEPEAAAYPTEEEKMAAKQSARDLAESMTAREARQAARHAPAS
jgi:hypothetical protein